ncbi:helix-turn-helix domain-containing protein [Flavobacterium granuli]|uniref:Helix-turn-helix domain-containing protein n=1 Tax=Flavobacterium granuli TaxID=280093 RepID=A0A1M5RKB4_9FLAO|nr:helix-turn-helix domain-containing protein [Flavobacterium granuli]PRZ22841.1 helix-turn-helix protein [Flavobacterium granuli]SHH26630.1 Helix-turn-helix domain-containing protein [Flavobacterium granuli]
MSHKFEKKQNNASIYRINLGMKLKKNRLMKGFSISDIGEMTSISKSSIIKIEKGEAKDIDNYVEYAKAVEYPFETLIDFKIKLEPLNELSALRKQATKLTAKIRKNIVNTSFLGAGKTTAEIREELIRINEITNTVKSTEIAGVMRNLVEDSILRKEKRGSKNLYLKS